MTALLLISAIIAGLTLLLCLWNMTLLTAAPTKGEPQEQPLVSVCVPARNEEFNLPVCLDSLLSQTYGNIEILVYDDESDDETPNILRRYQDLDPRVKQVTTSQLEDGWNGKQFACGQMAQQAKGAWLLFTDADVRFTPDCVHRTLLFCQQRGCDLVSAFPRQITKSIGEMLLVPLIHFLLLSYLPLFVMRRTRTESTAAGCGQFLCVTREAYDASDGHRAFPDSMHDGIQMPKAVRSSGYMTDLVDGTDLCSCRMYNDLATSWNGFAKNAYEGLGSVPLLIFITLIHLIAHILPWVMLVVYLAIWQVDQLPFFLAAIAVGCNIVQRTALAWRYRQRPLGIFTHPFGITCMTFIQWHSYYLRRHGTRQWRGRIHTT